MNKPDRSTMQNIFPALHYADAPAAIEWLNKAFGFEKQFVVPGENGTIAHAQLRLGPCLVMLGSAREDKFRMVAPAKAGGVTQAIYVCVDDTDAHYARAKAAGTEIVEPPADTDYGSRDYTARDPEGHLWHFGTYQPHADGS